MIHLQGGGEEGIGETSYHGEEHDSAQARGPVLPLAGSWTLHVLGAPGHAVALRAGARPARLPRLQALGIRERRPRPRAPAGRSLTRRRSAARGSAGRLRGVDGTGSPPSTDRLDSWIRLYPGLRFKLDANADWTDALIQQLAATGAVDSVDLKGQYRGTVVDAPADPGCTGASPRDYPLRGSKIPG